MLIQLANGKCIELSVEQYLRLSDQDLKELESLNWGEEINDPFAISVLKYGPSTRSRTYQENEDDEIEPDLNDISDEEKLSDSDFIDTDNIEI
jgi:hypothetical protein